MLSIYFIGIGGISMSALARIYQNRGYKVYGSDLHDSSLIHTLQGEGMEIKIGEAPQFVENSDIVVYTSAVDEENGDLILAKSLNKQIFSRAQILGELSKEFKTISVAGTHGKTTTTGMIANCLLSAKREPTIHVGGILNNIHSNLYIGKGDLLVTEACEYKDSFLTLKNFISVVLNIEEDHMDYFKTKDNLYKSFNKFIKNTSKNGIIIYKFHEKLKIPKNSISFGFEKEADVHAENIKMKKGKYSFDLFYLNKKIGQINLPCFGKHNILNALACSSVCIFLGLSFKEIKKGIESFSGAERRFEEISSKKALIIHDYAHHPKEIESTLKTCKEIDKNKKLIAIFQPHTYTRTRDLYNDFLSCFDLCDEVWLLPIYPAREEPIENITSLALAQDLIKHGKIARHFDTFSTCKEEIDKNNQKSNIIAILGAGDICNLAYSIK